MNQLALADIHVRVGRILPDRARHRGIGGGAGPYALVRWVGEPSLEAVVIAVIFGAGLWASTRAEVVLGITDPGPVVIDEVLGMLLTLAWLPLSLTGVLVGFVVFRMLDVLKPFPAGRLEHAPRGWGIMLDDAMAGVYGQLVMRLCIWLLPTWMVA